MKTPRMILAPFARLRLALPFGHRLYTSHLLKLRLNCGQLRVKHVGENVHLYGWIQAPRRLGGLNFCGLRDVFGVTQLVWDGATAGVPGDNEVDQLAAETVVEVEGKVRARPEEQVNERMQTGEVEVEVTRLHVLNAAVHPLPLQIHTKFKSIGNPEARLKYRYLDLRTFLMQRNLRVRHSVMLEARKFLSDKAFIEVETPTLFKSTPEGAREFLVPTRGQPGHCFALPQSPQQYKQLLMVGGIQRYFQIARCYRDESGRADRQPEFTQLDMEVSFPERSQLLHLCEGLMRAMWNSARASAVSSARAFSIPSSAGDEEEWMESNTPWPLRKDLPEDAFPVLSYAEAMDRFGSDKPDLRFPAEIEHVAFGGRQFQALVLDSIDDLRSRKQRVDALDTLAQECPSADEVHLVLLHINPDGSHKMVHRRPSEHTNQAETIEWFIGPNATKERQERVDAFLNSSGASSILFALGQTEPSCKALGAARLRYTACPHPEQLAVCWIVDFPLLEMVPASPYEEESHTSGSGASWTSAHNPFTAPRVGTDMQTLMDATSSELSPERIKALRGQSYDLVLNGVEVGGGSIRIHDEGLQRKILEDFLSHDAETFAHLLQAFNTGAPPHGGIAFGMDRILAIMCDTPRISDVIAFPKSTNGAEAMTGGPSYVHPDQLEEYGLRVIDPESST